MTRQKLSITIAIGFLALLGIIAVQLHWIRTAYVQNKISFEQNLNKALNQIVLDLSRQENIFFGMDELHQVRMLGNNATFIKIGSDSGKQLRWEHQDEEKTFRVETRIDGKKENIKRKIIGNPSRKKIVISSKGNDFEYVQEYYLDSLAEKVSIEQELKTSAITVFKKDSLLRKYEVYIDSVRNLLDYSVVSIASKKEDLNKTMVELFMNIKSVTRPFSERIPIDKLQKSIEKAIYQYDLPKSYAFAIVSSSTDSVLYKTQNFEIEELSKIESAQLFPHSVVSQPEHLYLSFPDSNPLFNQMLWPITLAFIFTLLLLASLLIIINNLLHHKKLSAIKTDFINNMTHEFKTPIATIQLATDTVMNEQILNDPSKINHFMSLIKSENKRMNALVERILQMAHLEKKSFNLIKSNVDIHQLIEAVVENSQLKIDQAKGIIKLNLNAEQNVLNIDEMHITNVLFNLIDNAIKYRKENLFVEINSVIQNKWFVLSIKDNGKGMTKETISQIFDKFFRLTEGNLHTIKGYGLGLSYVKAIIDKHQGMIKVKSQPNIGSIFEIYLPLKP